MERERNKKLFGKKDLRQVLLDLIKLPENSVCADCLCKGPRWASASIGVFVCIKCSGIHRNLGTHISFVRSVTLDEWKPEQVSDWGYLPSWLTVQVHKMITWGNANAKSYFEHKVPPSYQMPNEHASVQQTTQWIRDKWDISHFNSYSSL